MSTPMSASPGPRRSRLAGQDLVPGVQPVEDLGLAAGGLADLDGPLRGLAVLRGQVDDVGDRAVVGLVLEDGRGGDRERVRRRGTS